MRFFLKLLLAVLLGNALYFLAAPYLPSAARHQPFQIDLGLAVDAAFCLAVLGLLHLVVRQRS